MCCDDVVAVVLITSGLLISGVRDNCGAANCGAASVPGSADLQGHKNINKVVDVTYITKLGSLTTLTTKYKARDYTNAKCYLALMSSLYTMEHLVASLHWGPHY